MTETRDTTRQAAELAALRRVLVASRGCFSLSFAVCDDRGLRNELVRRLCEEFPGITTVALDPGTPDVYRVVRDRLIGTQPEAVFVLDLEASVPFQAEDYPTLRALNSSRELWEPLCCPVVFWLAAYAAALVAGKAPDLWRYRSHQFEFVSEPKALSEAIAEPIPGIEMVDALPFEEKRFRIAELEKRLQETGQDPSSEILPHVLNWISELALLYQHSNRSGEAEEWLRRALQRAESTYGSSSPRTAKAFNDLANLLNTTNRFEQAEPLIRRALAIDEQSYGPEHPEVARDLNNLALLLQDTNRLQEAEPLSRRHLDILLHFTRRTGYPHPLLDAALANYKAILERLGRSEAEVEADIRALQEKPGESEPGESGSNRNSFV